MDGHDAGATSRVRAARFGALAAAVAVATVAVVAVARTGARRRMYRLAAAKLDPGAWTNWVPGREGDEVSGGASQAPAPARTAWTREYLDVYEETQGTAVGDAAPDARSSAECRRACDARPYCAGYAFGEGRGCELFRHGHAVSSRERGVICARASRVVPSSTKD